MKTASRNGGAGWFRKSLAIVLTAVLVLVIVIIFVPGLLSYVKSKSPPSRAPITLDLHTGIEKPVIIFVHGLGGDSYKTWQHTEQNTETSFMQLIAQDSAFSGCAITSLRYPTNIFGATPSIPQLASKFADCLNKKFAKNSQIVIVAHSLGGIVARQGLAESGLLKRPQQFVTLITLGSPFEGSQLSNFAAGLSAYGMTSSQLSALGVNNELLQLCENNWSALRQNCGPQIRQFAASEGKPISRFLVVSKGSATKGVPPEFTFHSEDDTHLTLAKPATLNTPIGKKVREWILTALRVREYPAGEHTIAEDIEVPSDGLFVVQPGAKLQFRNGARLLAKGRIEAKGTEANPIIFDFDEYSNAQAGILLRGVDVAQSQFLHCKFRHGNGIGLNKPNPARHANLTRKELYAEKETLLTSVGNRTGGAVVVVGATSVNFTSCEFSANQAHQGGAMALFGSDRIQINHCDFRNNSSAFGGGAIFVQASDFYITAECLFDSNKTGDIATSSVTQGAATGLLRAACGGAVYLGFGAHVDIRDTLFRNNEASNAGGAIYAYDTHPPSWHMPGANQLSKLTFSGNKSHRGDGGAMRVDGETKTHLIDPLFEDNYSGPNPPASGPALRDESRAGFQVTNATWRRNGQGYAEQYRVIKSATTLARPAPSEELMNNPKSYKASDPRLIDTIVIHSISASTWNDPAFREQFSADLRTFESAPGNKSLLEKAADLKYQWRLCKQILELKGESVHYLIDRDGTMRQLVRDHDIAFHAGKSVMPPGDDRQNVDDFSIGVQLIGDNPSERTTPVADGDLAFTPAQYDALADLLLELSRRHRIPPKNIVKHSDISGERAVALGLRNPNESSTDPGAAFDWQLTTNRLNENLTLPAKLVLQPTPAPVDTHDPAVRK